MILLTILLLYNVLFFVIEEQTIKELAYEQNNLNLQLIVSNVEKIQNEKDLIKYFENNIKKLRSLGVTGDVFLIRLKDMRIIWDASTDCKINNKPTYFTKKSVCKLFNDPSSCIKASKIFKTKNNGNIKWLFDNDYEYVSFIKVKVGDNYYIIGQGAQRDEIKHFFLFLEIILYFFDILIILYIYLLMKQNNEEEFN